MKTYRIEYPTLGGASVEKEEIYDDNFKIAIKLWFDNKNEAIKKYGKISDWKLVLVYDMSEAFLDRENFNEDISKWNTSNVKNMKGMFKGAKNFNQPIGEWETSNVLNMESMFEGAEAFNKPIQSKPKKYLNPKEKIWNRSWNVSNVTNMKNMFKGAKKFNQSINNWDISKVENMEGMFEGAEVFNQPVNHWNVINVTNMENMFKGAKNFNQDIDPKLIIKFIELTNDFETIYGYGVQKQFEKKKLYIIYDYYVSWRPEKVLNFKNMFEEDFKKIPKKWYIDQNADLSENMKHLEKTLYKNLAYITSLNTIINNNLIKRKIPRETINETIRDEKDRIVNSYDNESLYLYKYYDNNKKEILVKNWKTLESIIKNILKDGKDYKDNIILLKEDKKYTLSYFNFF